MRDTARGAVSLERRTEDDNGDRVYMFTRPWSDGTTGITLSPLERLEKLAAFVPLPRVPLVRYGGCFAPHSPLRASLRLEIPCEIVPPRPAVPQPSHRETPASSASHLLSRLSRPRLAALRLAAGRGGCWRRRAAERAGRKCREFFLSVYDLTAV
jgi:hypothetical protein